MSDEAQGAAASPESEPAVEEVQQPSEEAKESEASTEQKGTADEPTGEAEESEKKEAEEKEERRSNVSKRLKQKTDQVREAESRAAAAERRAELAEQRLKEATGERDAPKRPTLKDFDYDEDRFQEALEDYQAQVAERANRRVQIQNEKDAAAEAQRELKEAVQARFKERVSAFEIDHADYNQFVTNNPNFVQAPHVASALMVDENGPAVAYHLAHPQNAQTLDDLNRGNPVDAILKIGALSERLKAPEPNLITKAPNPPKVTTPQGKAEKTLDDMPPEEYRRHRGYK